MHQDFHKNSRLTYSCKNATNFLNFPSFSFFCEVLIDFSATRLHFFLLVYELVYSRAGFPLATGQLHSFYFCCANWLSLSFSPQKIVNQRYLVANCYFPSAAIVVAIFFYSNVRVALQPRICRAFSN